MIERAIVNDNPAVLRDRQEFAYVYDYHHLVMSRPNDVGYVVDLKTGKEASLIWWPVNGHRIVIIIEQ